MEDNEESFDEWINDQQYFSEKIHNLVLQHIGEDDFQLTRRSFYVGVVGPFLTYGMFMVLKPTHPVKMPFCVSVFMGGLAHCLYSTKRDIQAACKKNTVFANKLRSYYQHLSKDNLYIPYFPEETILAAKHSKKVVRT